MSIHVTADWHEIASGDFYRKTELYSMDWTSNVDLDNFAFVGASYGGPLAIIRDDKKFTRVTPAIPAKPIISLYTASGNLINAIKWDSGVLIKMGWSSSEDLLCIQEDGNVLVYTIFGQLKETVHCLAGSETKEKAYEAEIYQSNNGTGVAYLTTKGNLIVMNNYKQIKTRRLARVPGEGQITAWSVICANRQTQIVAANDMGLFLVDLNQCSPITPEFSSSSIVISPPTIISISVSLNGEHVALYTDTGILWLGSADFQTKYCEIPTSISVKPKQIAWCGKEAVVVCWDSVPTLLLVNRVGQKITFPMDSKFYLISEIDSVRVVSNFTHEILQKVPEDTRLIFGIGSVAAGSWLVEASKEYALKSHKADDYMRCIQDIEEAVQQCIDAAGYEFHPHNQKMLMRAAQFGKCFLTRYSPEAYVHMCQMLRILNAVKDYKIAIPLTFMQLEQMTVGVLIDRLVLRRQYSLAFKIAEFLKLRDSQGRSRILAHWACFKVGQMHIEESKLADEIYGKLKVDSAVSYSEISNKAFEAGRKKLALSLAHYEARQSVQVPLFLKLGDSKTALHKAVESGDTNLIYDVLLKLRDSMPLSNFQMLIRNYPTAQSLYIKYCRIFNPEAVRNIYEIEDDYGAQASLCVQESLTDRRPESRMASLQAAQQMYTKGKNDFMASLCEEQNKLLKHQQALEQQYGESFLNLSLRDTLKRLLIKKEVKIAEKMRAEYKVSDRMFWLIRLGVLGEARDWTELNKLSKTKKIPGGFEDFVQVCLEFGNRSEALKYLPKVKEDVQVKYYVLAGYYEEAAKIALAQKDEINLQYVYSKCITVDRDIAAKVKEIMDSLKSSTGGGSSAGPSGSSR